jgi:hypothetical protein
MPNFEVLLNAAPATDYAALLDEINEFIESQSLKLDFARTKFERDRITITIINAEIMASRVRRRLAAS